MFHFVSYFLLFMMIVFLHARFVLLKRELETVKKYVKETSCVQHNLNENVTKIIGDVVIHVKKTERGE